MGPTASGKTDLALILREHFPVEIISVDSAMVYRGLDIGTAKPDADTLRKAPHRLIDIRDPVDAYSAGQFRLDALEHIVEIHAQGRIPLLVGGTGLYFRSLEKGIADLPSADPEIRKRLSAEAELISWQSMHDKLSLIDAPAAKNIHPNDPQRIQRALEVFEISGKPLSSFYAEDAMAMLPYNLTKLQVLPSSRDVLHDRIRIRFEQMIEFGLVEEVEGLYAREDLSLDLPSMRLVGYRQVWQYLDGQLNKTEMVEKAIVATRQLAKRQMTWLRSEENINTFDSLEAGFERKILNFLEDDLNL